MRWVGFDNEAKPERITDLNAAISTLDLVIVLMAAVPPSPFLPAPTLISATLDGGQRV